MREALKLALEALEGFYEYGYDRRECFEHITAIKEALAQPEQEPVAWHEGESIYWHTDHGLNDWIRTNGTPLYTAPPQRKPLTDEEIGAILEGVNAYGTRLYTFARAIEAKLKEKNT